MSKDKLLLLLFGIKKPSGKLEAKGIYRSVVPDDYLVRFPNNDLDKMKLKKVINIKTS